jgi:hypothetical protein
MTAATMTEPRGLAALDSLELEPPLQRLVDFAEGTVQGSAAWRRRKVYEVRKLAALAQLAPRMRIGPLDARTDLGVMIELRMPVACLEPGASDVVLRDRVELALKYPIEILRRPVPGPSIVQIVDPPNVHHPNVGPPVGSPQAVCLGVNVPRGYPLVEAVLASYAALCMQNVSLSFGDHAGVMNAQAVVFWDTNRARLPLTRDAFLAPLPTSEDPS